MILKKRKMEMGSTSSSTSWPCEQSKENELSWSPASERSCQAPGSGVRGPFPLIVPRTLTSQSCPIHTDVHPKSRGFWRPWNLSARTATLACSITSSVPQKFPTLPWRQTLKSCTGFLKMVLIRSSFRTRTTEMEISSTVENVLSILWNT